MRPRRQRLLFIGLVLAGMTTAAAFAYRAFQENAAYFFSPADIAEGKAPVERAFRLGGMVVEGSVTREEGSLTTQFVVTDLAHTVPVVYDRMLPPLFEEGQSVVARGRLDTNGTFVAEEVLAKHDENYMPPEVAKAIERGREASGQ